MKIYLRLILLTLERVLDFGTKCIILVKRSNKKCKRLPTFHLQCIICHNMIIALALVGSFMYWSQLTNIQRTTRVNTNSVYNWTLQIGNPVEEQDLSLKYPCFILLSIATVFKHSRLWYSPHKYGLFCQKGKAHKNSPTKKHVEQRSLEFYTNAHKMKYVKYKN